MIIFKLIHISCAAVSITGFLARSFLKFTAPHYLQHRWIKISPHLIDTVLLASAVVLVIQTRQYPFVDAWVTAKLLVLLLYIGFGLLTLRFAKTRLQTTAGFVGACLSFSYIIAVALTKQVWPF
jgi:uncharacterized membrane protein SirB2